MHYPIVVSGDELRKAVDLLIDGLVTDGSHHKQWYIERSLESLGVNLDEVKLDLAADDYAWEPGIAP